MKCLGAGVGDVDPIDIEILKLASGAPRIFLRGRAAEIAEGLNLKAWHVSITHEAGWAAAIAVAEGGTAGQPLPGQAQPDSPASHAAVPADSLQANRAQQGLRTTGGAGV